MNQKISNQNVIADYLNEGCTPRRAFCIGLEIAHFVLKRDQTNASYEEITGILRKMVQEGVPAYDENGRVNGFYNEIYSVSLDAAAQLEVSIFPQDRISDIQKIYENFLDLFSSVTRKDGYILATMGYQPNAKAETLKLIPNKRFEYMNAYFKESGSMGLQMMRGTAATHIAIDYEDEEDYIRKYRLACVLTPIIELLTDNAPIYEGKPYLKHLLHNQIWSHVDPARCGIPHGIFEEDFGFDKYAEYIYTREPILIMEEGNTSIVFRKTADAFYQDRDLHKTEAEHLLNMVYPDVRTKQYIEIRCADSMPKEYAMAYAAMIKGIFYSEDAMERLESTFVVLSEEEICQAKEELMKSGYRGKIYGMSAKDAVEKVLTVAKSGLPVKEEVFLEPLERLVAQEQTLAQRNKFSRKIS